MQEPLTPPVFHILLALAAALVNLPIREAAVHRAAAAAAAKA